MEVSQFSPDGRLSHLLTLENLPPALLREIFTLSDSYAAGTHKRPLSGRLVVNIFFESSTRTRTAFEAAAKQLGADVVNLDQIRMAGGVKKESLQDTVRTVSAMGAAALVLRHGENGTAAAAAAAAPAGVAVINGGDGSNAHPTQGLTDAYTLREHIGDDFSDLSVAIIGDVLRSRVARSDIHILRALGVRDIRLVGPPFFCPPTLAEEFNVRVEHDLMPAITDVDAVILLRVQRERGAFVDSDFAAWAEEKRNEKNGASVNPYVTYFNHYGLTAARLNALKKDVVIMHPGPINRNVEIDDAVADGSHSLILRQVTNGMAIRKAVLTKLCAQ